MRVVFRVDASPSVGVGHLARCLALAKQLQKRGAVCQFICSADTATWAEKITQDGHALSYIDAKTPGDISDAEQCITALESANKTSWLVVDHYCIDAHWHTPVRRHVGKIFVIDDLASRTHDADALLDPSPLAQVAAYKQLASRPCQQFIGPKYGLLREEFARLRQQQGRSHCASKRIHLAFGGTDPAGNTRGVAQLLLESLPTFSVVALLGAQPPAEADLRELQKRFGARLAVKINTSQIAQSMLGCVAAIGAPGGMLWERFCMGLPMACLTTSANQRSIVEALAAQQWLLDLGPAEHFSHNRVHELLGWLTDGAAMDKQRQHLQAEVDGLGAHRIAHWMMENT